MVQDGVMTVQPHVTDIPDTNIVGSSTIALGTESVNLKLKPRAEDSSLLAGQAPQRVEGGFRDINIDVSKLRIAFPLLTSIELNTADGADYQHLIQAVRQQ
jgi:hypothetical protein